MEDPWRRVKELEAELAEGPWWAWDAVDYEEGRVQRLEAELAAARAAALSAPPRSSLSGSNRAILTASSAPALMQQGCSNTADLAETSQADGLPMRIPPRPAGQPPDPSACLRPSDVPQSFSHCGRPRRESPRASYAEPRVVQRLLDDEEEAWHGHTGSSSVGCNRQVQHPSRPSIARMSMGPPAAGMHLTRCPAEPMVGCGTAVGGGVASAYEVGQAVLLHSHSQDCWVEARVAQVWPDVSITVTYDDGNLQKHIPAEAQSALLRPMLPGTPSPHPRLQHSKTRQSRGSGVVGMQSPRQHELTSAPGGASAVDGTGVGACCSESAALPNESPRTSEVQSKPGILRRGRSSAQRSESRRLRVTFSADSKGGSGFTGAVRVSPRPPNSPRYRTRSSSEPRRSLEVPTLSRSRGLTKLPKPGLTASPAAGLSIATNVETTGGGQDALLPRSMPGSPLMSAKGRSLPPTAAAAVAAAAAAAAAATTAAATSVPPLPTHSSTNIQQSGCSLSSSGGGSFIASQAPFQQPKRETTLVHSQSQGPPWLEARVTTAWSDTAPTVPTSPAHSTAITPQASTAPATTTTTPAWQPWAPVSAAAPTTSPSKVAEACVVLNGSRRRLPRYGGC
mmetsp:Transcript_14637/g.28359  ORF Transcript_14637/g.28359 Transcript_14637/m.28359 type:complete len:622 (-) Transcript_14637:42-1907(-)